MTLMLNNSWTLAIDNKEKKWIYIVHLVDFLVDSILCWGTSVLNLIHVGHVGLFWRDKGWVHLCNMVCQCVRWIKWKIQHGANVMSFAFVEDVGLLDW